MALVTGGGGIGRAIALELAATGAAVAVVDVDRPAAVETARLVSESGGTALAIAADVTDGSQAGIEGVVAPLPEYAEDVFDAVLRVNVRGVFLGLQHVLVRFLGSLEAAHVNGAAWVVDGGSTVA